MTAPNFPETSRKALEEGERASAVGKPCAKGWPIILAARRQEKCPFLGSDLLNLKSRGRIAWAHFLRKSFLRRTPRQGARVCKEDTRAKPGDQHAPKSHLGDAEKAAHALNQSVYQLDRSPTFLSHKMKRGWKVAVREDKYPFVIPVLQESSF